MLKLGSGMRNPVCLPVSHISLEGHSSLASFLGSWWMNTPVESQRVFVKSFEASTLQKHWLCMYGFDAPCCSCFLARPVKPGHKQVLVIYFQ